MQVSIARKIGAFSKIFFRSQLASLTAVSIVGAVGLPSIAGAATLTVTSIADDGSAGTLRSVIQSAASGDTVDFSSTRFASYQTIELKQGLIPISKDLTIVGPRVHVALDAQHLSGVMSVMQPCMSLSISNVTFENGSATDGGGLHLDVFQRSTIGTATLTDCAFMRCIASGDGGGLDNDIGNLVLDNCIFRGNSAASGGAFSNGFLEGLNRVQANACTFWENVAQNGGAVNNRDVATLVNCTIWDNTASSVGGAYRSQGDNVSVFPSNTLFNCTIAGNSASNGGGVGISGAKFVTATNCILFGDGGGEVYDPAHILVAKYSDVQGGFAGTGNIAGNPLLGPLANNGGPVETMAVFPGSPCIGVGTGTGMPLTDARGVTRPDPPCMGAYEFSAGPDLKSVSPNWIIAGSTGVTLTATGSSFLPTSKVLWNGSLISTTYISSTELKAVVPNADVAAVGTAKVSVATPSTGQASSSLTISIVPDAVSGLTLAPANIVGGGTSTATLTLVKPAPQTGVTVSLSSSNSQVAAVPHAVAVPPGASSVKFAIKTYPVTAQTSVTISATLGAKISAKLTVMPPAARSLSINPPSIRSSGSATAMLVLTGRTAVDTPVTVTESDPAAVSVNGPVIVPSGQYKVAFTLNALSVSTRVVEIVDASITGDTVDSSLRIIPRQQADWTEIGTELDGEGVN